MNMRALRRTLLIVVTAIVFTSPTLNAAMQIPDQIKEVVGFLFVDDPSGRVVPQGTGFFVGVFKPGSTNEGHAYFITAKHVLYRRTDNRLYESMYLRLNTISGGSDVGKIELRDSGKQKNVFLPSDPTVDLAAIILAPDPKRHAAKILTSDYLTTKEQFKQLGEGSDIFFTGLFVSHVGERKNYPIVRFGRVALLSDEPIDFVNFKSERVKAELVLIEAQSYGGNSGSPVFYYLGADRQPGSLIIGPPELKLAGVMSGSFNDIVEVKAAQTAVVPVVTPNNGIAAVVPAYKLSELLFSDELKKQRGY
jgi:hypothetical protein